MLPEAAGGRAGDGGAPRGEGAELANRSATASSASVGCVAVGKQRVCGESVLTVLQGEERHVAERSESATVLGVAGDAQQRYGRRPGSPMTLADLDVADSQTQLSVVGGAAR